MRSRKERGEAKELWSVDGNALQFPAAAFVGLTSRLSGCDGWIDQESEYEIYCFMADSTTSTTYTFAFEGVLSAPKALLTGFISRDRCKVDDAERSFLPPAFFSRTWGAIGGRTLSSSYVFCYFPFQPV